MGEVEGIGSPELLQEHHELEGFNSGVAVLDDWLKRRARTNQASGASRTYVAADSKGVVAAYYALASGVIQVAEAPGRFRRNMPDPIPVVILGRLAVDKHWQGKGIGRALFRDAAKRIAQAAEVIGIRGIVVHAISDEAKRFYEALGFEASRHEPMTSMVTLGDVNAVLEGH